MPINKEIFRAYDIRGNGSTDITEIVAYKIGFCFAEITISNSNNKICVGRDGRLTSPTLYNSLVKGLIDGGASVISIGVVPTPLLYFADKKLSPAASIMITGSHNPKDDNGFKMVVGSKSFFGSQIQDLLIRILDSSFNVIPTSSYVTPASPTVTPASPYVIPAKAGIQKTINNKLDSCFRRNDSGNSIEYNNNIKSKYLDRILDNISINPKLKVAWDPGNGAAGDITEALKKRLPNNNIVINSTIDGNFPSHHPDPTKPSNLKQLIEIVTQENCDIGIAFDGDGDRLGIVSSKGQILFGDQIICLFAEDILKEYPKATIILDVKASQLVIDQIKSYGGQPLIWRTGHPFIKSKMQETNALLAGEMSGHIFFADKYYGYDDAVYAALRFLDLLSRSNKSLDEFIENLPKSYSTPEIKIAVSDTMKFKIIAEIKEQLLKEGVEFNDIDGVRVNTEQGWWLLRSSNTEPAIIARAESISENGLEKITATINRYLKKYELLINY
ncbi:phosphomannomutase/phosphoglucomutase [Rickettsia endosymbiont of Halotydeus destructor]|uniref:phosphomannomutase/phosphoglucomutase n=1 Tax=Rickettsia endosymbiont of Halotydeus destructor TaxID=2996754 RepID=UPI003BAF0B57